MQLARLITATSILICSVKSYSWQLPGHEGSDYKATEYVAIHADKLSSDSVAAYDFDYKDFWCKPSEDHERQRLNITDYRSDNEIEMIDTSMYYHMNLPFWPMSRQCMRRYTEDEVDHMKFMAEYDFTYRLWMDGLPSVVNSKKHED